MASLLSCPLPSALCYLQAELGGSWQPARAVGGSGGDRALLLILRTHDLKSQLDHISEFSLPHLPNEDGHSPSCGAGMKGVNVLGAHPPKTRLTDAPNRPLLLSPPHPIPQQILWDLLSKLSQIGHFSSAPLPPPASSRHPLSSGLLLLPPNWSPCFHTAPVPTIPTLQPKGSCSV